MTDDVETFANKLRIINSLEAHELEGMSSAVKRQFLVNSPSVFLKMHPSDRAIVWEALRKREARNAPI